MRSKPERWTNSSVVAFADGRDPVQAVTERARELAMAAMDQGWSGPPFDPVVLAELLKIDVVARDEVRDARTVRGESGNPRIEYNPSRPRGRVRYSLAHEIAHTMFSDWSEEVRNRSERHELKGDEWQLEALCNIAAAEFVMPLGSFTNLGSADLDLDLLLAEQKRYDVSMEALLIRAVHLRNESCAIFCASPLVGGAKAGRYRIDYVIGSRAWPTSQGYRGLEVPADSVVSHCSAIGFTAKGSETWRDSIVRIEAVGIPPYPGSPLPRVVGLITPVATEAEPPAPLLEYVIGDATKPHGSGTKMIVQIVSDGAITWGGGGFAAALRRARPAAQEEFRAWVGPGRENLKLGRVHFARLDGDVQVASIVAQHGYGPSPHPRVRYAALKEGLTEIARVATTENATLHMARIGCGLAGGSWDIVEELLWLTVGAGALKVTVYDLPGRRAAVQDSLFSQSHSRSQE